MKNINKAVSKAWKMATQAMQMESYAMGMVDVQEGNVLASIGCDVMVLEAADEGGK